MPYRQEIRNGEWTGSWTFEKTLFAKRHRITIRAKKSAIADLYRKWEQDVYDSITHKRKTHNLSVVLDEYLNWIKPRKSLVMQKQEEYVIGLMKTFFKDINLEDIERTSIEDFIQYRREYSKKEHGKEIAPATINRTTASVSYFFNWCIKRNYYHSTNPAYRMKLEEANERVVVLSKVQIRELFEKANEYQGRIVFLGIMTGMRVISELCKLQWNNVDLDNGFIYLAARGTKSKRRRTIPMPKPLWNYLKQIREKELENVYVITYNGKPIKYPRRAWEGLRDKLSFKVLPDGSNLRFHDLRHVYAVLLRMAGTALSDIKELLGHTTLAVTLRYAHYDGAVMHEKVKALDEMLPPDENGTNEKNVKA